MLVLGNKDLLDAKKAVVLNSSQSKIPCGNDPWIKSTSRAIRYAVNSDFTILSSLGLNTWEFCVHLAANERGGQVMICPDFLGMEPEELFKATIEEFSLEADRIAMIFAAEKSNKGRPKSNWTERDRMAVELADLLIPVSVRPGGKMTRLIETSANRKLINPEYRIDYQKPVASPPRYDFKNKSDDGIDSEYITHWTRTCHGPWPGQTRDSYYSAILASGDTYPNHGFATLRNMVLERRIRASAKRIRGGSRSIAFTESDPDSVLSAIRWLPKRSNWNFEPYAISVRKDKARESGIRQVIYGEASDYETLSENERPYFQSIGSPDTNWSREREWRHTGDLDLLSFDDDDLKYLVYLESEAKILRQLTSSPVIDLEYGRARR